MKIHPRLAGAVFIIIYYLAGILISKIINIKIYESIIFMCIGAVLVLIISIIFGNKYYDEIVEEKKREEEIFNTKENDEE